MRDILFVTGAFSSGKTVVGKTISDYLQAEDIPFVFLSDGHYLAQLVDEGQEGKWFVRPEKENPGFCIIDQEPLEKMYDRLVEDIPAPGKGSLVLVEAARCQGDGYPELDISFLALKEKVPSSVWSRSVVIYTHASWEKRSLWNQDRQDNPRDQLEGLSFYVPQLAMESLARKDDFHEGFSSWLKDQGVPIYEINNNHLSFEALQQVAGSLIRRISREQFLHRGKEGKFGLTKEALI
jgi:hypothetical protein